MSAPGSPTRYKARTHYTGGHARDYTRDRTRTPSARRKWRSEFSALERLVATLPRGARVLDCPCGTGRFLPSLRRHGLVAIGSDISLDMLTQARAVEESTPPLLVCDAEHLPLPADAVQYAMSIRFFNLLPFDTVRVVLGELARVTTEGIIIQARFRGERAFPDATLRWARERVLPLLCGSATRPSPRSAVADERRVFPPLRLGALLELVSDLDLVIARTLTVGGLRGLLQPDRLQLVLLEHRPRRA